jgi:hypothetical protein
MKFITIAIEEEPNEANGFIHHHHAPMMNFSRVLFKVLKSGDVVVVKRRSIGRETAKQVKEWMDQILLGDDEVTETKP